MRTGYGTTIQIILPVVTCNNKIKETSVKLLTGHLEQQLRPIATEILMHGGFTMNFLNVPNAKKN